MRSSPLHRRRRESGQAAVESALSLPLVIFLILGTLQLFMLLQARILAQVAVYRAVRAGSLNHGNCRAMTHAALVTMLPTVAATHSGPLLTQAFRTRERNFLRMHSTSGSLFSEGPMVELVRESPDAEWVRGLARGEDLQFDTPTNSAAELRRRTLEVRMVAWYYMRIPFADWVLSRMFLAHFRLKPYTAANPLMPADRRADGWSDGSVAMRSDSWPGGDLGRRMLQWSGEGHYLFPIQVNAAMRMMTPARAEDFRGGGACSLHGF